MKKRSVAGIAIRQGKVFVARRLPGGSLGGKWEFPGGKLEPGETDQQALVREYQEEFDSEISVIGKLAESEFAHNGCQYELAAWEIGLPARLAALREHTETAWVDRLSLERLDLADSDRSLLPAILARLG